MDAEMLRLRAHVDQTRSEVRAMIKELERDELVSILQTCAAGELHEFDDRVRLLVGLLAVVSIFDLIEDSE